MKKTLLLSLVVLGFSSASFASGAMPTPVAPPEYFSGFNLGANLGIQHEVGNMNNDFLNTYTNTVATEIPYTYTTQYNFSQSSDLGSTDFNAGISLGYGMTFNTSFYAGLEAFGRYAHAKTNTNLDYYYNEADDGVVDYYENGNSSVDVKTDWAFGGDVKLGYLVTPKTLFYVLAGVEAQRLNVDVNHLLSRTGTGDVPYSHVTAYGYSFDKTKAAFMPGVGIETMLTDKLSLDARYTYAWYGSTGDDFVNPTQSFTPITMQTTTTLDSASHTDVKLNRGLYTLGLTYHFNGI